MTDLETVGDCGRLMSQTLRFAEHRTDGGVPVQPTHPKITELRAFGLTGDSHVFGVIRGTGYESYYDELGNLSFAQHEALDPEVIDGTTYYSEQYGIGIFDKEIEAVQGIGRLSIRGNYGRFALDYDLHPIDINPDSTTNDTRLSVFAREMSEATVWTPEELKENHARLIGLAYFFRDPAADLAAV